MPTSQPLSSPSKPATPSADTPNGISQDSRNGDIQENLANGSQGGGDGTESPVADQLRLYKLKAKAQMSATGHLSDPTDIGKEARTSNGDMQTASPAMNGNVQTRKRSRSGNLITRTEEEDKSSPRLRGKDDSEGKLLEKFKIAEFNERDLLHWSAIISDSAEDDGLHVAKLDERDFYMRIRGQKPLEFPPRKPIKLPTVPDQPHVKPQDEYHVMPRMARNSIRPAPIRENYLKSMYGRAPFLVGTQHQARDPKLPQRPNRKITLRRKDLEKHAEQLDDLVPIRLDIEWEHADLGKIRLRDTFTWNLHERLIEPQIFAETLVEDFGLSLDKCKGLVDIVKANIDEQIQDYYPHVFLDEGPVDPNLNYDAYKDDELRITIKLNITIGQHTLVDQFEWDLNNSTDSAELFAKQMAAELSLSGEFTTAIAHSIREQCQLFTRSLYVLGHQFDGRPVTDEDLKSGLGPSPLPSSFRPYQAAKEFYPYFYELNDAELEKTELSLSREERRQKRSVYRRGGPSLPDIKDRQRTIRTLVLSSVIPGAAETLEDSKIFKQVPVAKSKKAPYAKDGEDDSDDESDSSSEEPIPSHLLAGTARTRAMRGTATAAQAAIKGSLGRSATPEVFSHHERTPVRKTGGRDHREESVEDSPTSLIVKLRIPKDRFRRFWQDMAKNKNKSLSAETPGHTTRRSQSATPGNSTPGPSNMGPPTTPAQPSQQAPQGSPGQLRDGQPINPLHPHAAQLGRVDASGPPSPTNPAPPPPSWLTQSLNRLQQSWPDDKFEGLMRYTSVSLETDLPVSREAPPNTIKYMYYPRIKCLDCPGKNYTPGPETGVTNFEVHLRNRAHRDKVEARVAREKSKNDSV